METDDVVIADIGGQALDIFLHGPESAHKNGILKTFSHTSFPIQPRTLAASSPLSPLLSFLFSLDTRIDNKLKREKAKFEAESSGCVSSLTS